MAIFSSTQPSLRARILPRFPAQVLAGNGMVITKSGGTYIFAVSAEMTFTKLFLPNLLVAENDAGAALVGVAIGECYRNSINRVIVRTV